MSFLTTAGATAKGFNQSVSAAQQSGQTYLDTLTNKYFLKPQATVTFGGTGFVFDIAEENRQEQTADITDHYIEDNTAIQDHIALHPERITLRGFIGELKQISPLSTSLSGAFKTINNKLGQAGAYLGKYTPGMVNKIQSAVNQAQQVTNQVNNAINSISNLVGLFSSSTPAQTKQSRAYYILSALRVARQLFIIETPYGQFQNMAIESITFVQPKETIYWSDITITLKEIRMAVTTTVKADPAKMKAKAYNSQAAKVGSGITIPKPLTSDTATPALNIFNGLKGLVGL
jgi:hypothetical protein